MGLIDLNKTKGFTLMEVLIVVAIIAILGAIAYPSYQNYVIRTKRADMMTELQNIGRQIESRKLAAGRGGYKTLADTNGLNDLLGNYPRQGNPLYTVTVNDLESGNWILTSTPLNSGSQAADGELTLANTGRKCRANACGMGDEWR